MNRTEHLLTILAEECTEVAQRCTKALRFTLDEVQPGQELSNAQRIVDEIDDVLGVFGMLRAGGLLPPTSHDRQEAKKAKVEQYLKLSEAWGALSFVKDMTPEERLRFTSANNPTTLGGTVVTHVPGSMLGKPSPTGSKGET